VQLESGGHSRRIVSSEAVRAFADAHAVDGGGMQLVHCGQSTPAQMQEAVKAMQGGMG
jgi:hypothetical protein